MIGHVQKGHLNDENGSSLDPLQQVYPYWLSLVDYLKLKAFVELTLTDNIRTGIQQVWKFGKIEKTFSKNFLFQNLEIWF